MDLLNQLASRVLCTLANVYILDDKIIKYRWGSEDSNNVKCLLKQVNIVNSLDLKKDYDYLDGFTVAQIKKHLAELIHLGKNVIIQDKNKIEIYTNKENESWFKDEISAMNLDKWKIEIVI